MSENLRDPLESCADRTITMETAKLGFAIIATATELINKDIDCAYILFALILRTQWEAGSESKLDGVNRRQENVANNIGMTANVYELAKYTGLNRITVRRKMLKMEKLGLVSRFDDERWVLGRDGEEIPDQLLTLIEQIRIAAGAFQAPIEGSKESSEDGGNLVDEILNRTKITPEEARKKIAKGAFYILGSAEK